MDRILLAVLAIIFSSGQAYGFSQKKTSEAVQASSKETVWVTQSDGAKSCSAEPAATLESSAEALKKAGIQILDSSKGNDGKMHTQNCGAPKGTLNGYLIPRADLPKALAMGFEEAHKNFR